MSKQSQATVETKQNLIEAFWSIYETKRIERITIREITDRAGYNRSTFYTYFVDIYDLLRQAELSVLPSKEDFELAINSFNQGTEPAIRVMLEIFNRNMRYYNILFGEHGDPHFSNKIKQLVKDILLDYLLNCGLYNDSVELEYFIEYSVSAIIGIMTYWLKRNKEIPLEKFIEIHSKILVTSPIDLLSLNANFLI